MIDDIYTEILMAHLRTRLHKTRVLGCSKQNADVVFNSRRGWMIVVEGSTTRVVAANTGNVGCNVVLYVTGS